MNSRKYFSKLTFNEFLMNLFNLNNLNNLLITIKKI